MVAWMALAGGLGAVVRFFVDGEVKARHNGPFPLATLLINLLGALLLGVLAGLVSHHGVSPDVRFVVGTGFCGGITTFSTAMVESVRLLQARQTRLAVGYLVATVAGGLAAAALGFLA